MAELVARGARVDANVAHGTALSWAVCADQVDAAAWLLDRGADPDLRHDFGGGEDGGAATALHLAARYGCVRTLRLLVARGADRELRDGVRNATPLDWARRAEGEPSAATSTVAVARAILENLAPGPTPDTLSPNPFVDSAHPAIVAFAEQHAGHLPPREAAVVLYGLVRERLRYNPWRVRFRPEDYRASDVLARDPAEGGHCIDKALLLAAACRALGIPSRLHFANVRNHIGTAELERKLGTDLLVFHGYTELWLGGRWVAATPAFNLELCRHLGVAPMEFDGENDSIFQEYDAQGGQFMEYVEDHGSHVGVPFDAMLAQWRLHYPSLVAGGWPERGG
jgi:transglutaminase-like putative cysteine protease